MDQDLPDQNNLGGAHWKADGFCGHRRVGADRGWIAGVDYVNRLGSDNFEDEAREAGDKVAWSGWKATPQPEGRPTCYAVAGIWKGSSALPP